jgi:hypothetical protein
MLSTVATASVVHRLYGIRIRTAWPVSGVAVRNEAWDVELLEGDPETLAAAAAHVSPAHRSRWAQSAMLPDGSAYRRWTDLFEFLVTPDARQIYARLLGRHSEEAMLAYLLVDALSFSMVRLGKEPVHATAVVTDRGAIAVLGNSGDGKSTLAAMFLRTGAKLLTDDMLVLTPIGNRWLAQPGPPRIKLYRPIAERILGRVEEGIPMNGATEKLIIPVAANEVSTEPVPLAAIYLLDHHGDSENPCPAIHRLSPAAAFPRVLAHTAGHYPSEEHRLRRQFDFATALVREVPISTLSYRHDESEMWAVRDAVLANLKGSID